MSEENALPKHTLTILGYLWDEATQGRGWLRRGVRGWRMYREIRSATREYLSEQLPHMVRCELLDRVDVLEPGRQRTVQLYRISDYGAERLVESGARTSGHLAVPMADDPSEGTFYVPICAWSALRTLRMYAAERVGPLRLGEHGWMLPREIRRADPCARTDTLQWLQIRGLIERRDAPDAKPGKRRTFLYRVTERGRQVEPEESVRSPRGIEYIAVRMQE